MTGMLRQANRELAALVQVGVHVDVVTDGIAEIREHSIVTTDGVEREIDTLICGTGFYTTEMPVADLIHGRGERSLRDAWQGGVEAYLTAAARVCTAGKCVILTPL